MSGLWTIVRRIANLGGFCGPRLSEITNLIVGVGNPGRKYQGTRHNVGFEVVDRLAVDLRAMRWSKRAGAQFTTGQLAPGSRVAVAKPLTYVNQSGLAVNSLLKMLNLESARCLVVVDDLNLPLGKLRLRRQGSDGGHNGLKSIIAEIGEGFPRLRLGVGPVAAGTDVVSFVLGAFESAEAEAHNKMIQRAAEAVLYCCESGVEAAMEKFNR